MLHPELSTPRGELTNEAGVLMGNPIAVMLSASAPNGPLLP